MRMCHLISALVLTLLSVNEAFVSPAKILWTPRRNPCWQGQQCRVDAFADPKSKSIMILLSNPIHALDFRSLWMLQSSCSVGSDLKVL